MSGVRAAARPTPCPVKLTTTTALGARDAAACVCEAAYVPLAGGTCGCPPGSWLTVDGEHVIPARAARDAE